MDIVNDTPLERHPWPAFVPAGARLLIMGTFPPGRHRWKMDFYYPNPTNDFWRIMGLIFLNDKDALYDKASRTFDEQAIRRLMAEHHIALNDTAREVRRLKGNASDKFLDIVTPVPLEDLLREMPACQDVATTGEKAAEVIAGLTDTEVPKIGQFVASPTGLRIWRMPSTSRAYPLAVEKKAEYYAEMFREIGLID